MLRVGDRDNHVHWSADRTGKMLGVFLKSNGFYAPRHSLNLV